MNTPTEKLVAALHVLANDIQSDDGVANAVIQEAALRLTEQSEKLKGLRNGILQNNGMTLRDYFAAAALQGMIAAQSSGGVLVNDLYAEYAYDLSDAMLKAREAKP